MHSKNLSAYLNSAAGIAGLMPQAERLIELRRLYKTLVPQQLLRSSSIVNYKQQKVVIFAENNAVAAKLKLLTPRLVSDFSKCGVETTGIRIEVQPQGTHQSGPGSKRAKLSPGGALSLETLARRLPEGDLKLAVQNFASRNKT